MKEKVLNALKSNMSQYTSGEELSKLLGVSRTAVWKHMKELKNEGYEIEASSKKGYRLLSVGGIINAHEISYDLKTEIIGRKIIYFDTIDSTNNYAKKIAYAGCEDGTVVLADSQSEGRGRLGRHWDSVPGKGIWMSVVLKPFIAPEEAQMMTLAASVAVVAALKSTTRIMAGIKWPNDIILNGKKVCGLLTEMNAEMERINFLIVGIGMNVTQVETDFPEDLREKATSLKIQLGLVDSGKNQEFSSVELSRSEIIKSLLYELERIYSKINNGFISDVLEEWRKYSLTIGKEVSVVLKGIEYTGLAEDITKDGKLLVNCTDGVRREVHSGEVSVRGILGYV